MHLQTAQPLFLFCVPMMLSSSHPQTMNKVGLSWPSAIMLLNCIYLLFYGTAQMQLQAELKCLFWLAIIFRAFEEKQRQGKKKNGLAHFISVQSSAKPTIILKSVIRKDLVGRKLSSFKGVLCITAFFICSNYIKDSNLQM